MICIQNQPDIGSVRLGIAECGHAVVPGLLSRDEAARIESVTSSLPVRRSYRGIKTVTFDAQRVGPGDELHELFESDPLVSTARAALGLPEGVPVRGLIGWIHRYKTGEYIPAHRDAAGDIQIAIAIHQPPPENGGTLFVEGGRQASPVPLATGDALFFLARDLTHYSVPLVSTPERPRPTKVVAVGRYYF